MTSKERARLKGLAATADTIVQIGKSGITESVVASVDAALKARELVKGKVLETALLTAREASDELCQALKAEGIQCVGNKFVVWRHSETLAKKTGLAHPKVKVNPVRTGIKRRRAAAKAARERRNEYFRKEAVEFIRQRRREERGED